MWDKEQWGWYRINAAPCPGSKFPVLTIFHALQHFGVSKCPLQKKWSEQLSTPKKLEWAVVHSKMFTFLEWNVVNSIFSGVDFECIAIFFEWT
jgi:hypothetical protein